MKYCNNVRLSEPRFCDVCQKKSKTGKRIPMYRDKFDFVCDSCYSTYFKGIEKVEIGRFTRMRPADVQPDRYMMRSVFASSILIDMLVWPVIGGMLKGLGVLCGFAYPEVFHGTNPFFLQCMMAIYAFFTAVGLLNTIRLFVSSLLRGVNTSRRIILLVKAVEYAMIVAAALIGIL